MKKYLIITPQCPYPPHKDGGVHTVYNILKNLPNDINMDLFYYSEKDSESETVIGRFVNTIFHHRLTKEPGAIARGINFIRKYPDCFSKLNFNGFNCNFEFEKYDVVLLDQITSLPFVKIIAKEIKIICLMHDNHVLMYQRKYKQEHNWIKKFYDKKQSQYFLRIEEKYYEHIFKVIYVSSLDAELAKEMHSEYKNIFDNIVLGVDIPDNTQISTPENPYSFVFSGVMDYPEAIFVIAGKNPPESVLCLNSKDIIVTGFVDDMVKTITKSAIYVSPLRYGSGTKNKVLEAMAAGMPVVATEVSREGIDGLADKENCFFATEENIADILINVLSNRPLLEQVAKSGRDYVERHHSWQNVFDKFLVT